MERCSARLLTFQPRSNDMLVRRQRNRGGNLLRSLHLPISESGLIVPAWRSSCEARRRFIYQELLKCRILGWNLGIVRIPYRYDFKTSALLKLLDFSFKYIETGFLKVQCDIKALEMMICLSFYCEGLVSSQKTLCKIKSQELLKSSLLHRHQ